ncbi:hypothetical protein SBOR_4738 [Sclerotinia borealis F-4128]|uniref:Uncharacterized protein n=1 Tax=Sclerotinia borealis (strain F-4128) TaxID=1432307 RepID=W9CDP4_SCLBF|nr:hypothetical protein SBOR_4738 [Sclerotinia borealis F-4128]
MAEHVSSAILAHPDYTIDPPIKSHPATRVSKVAPQPGPEPVPNFFTPQPDPSQYLPYPQTPPHHPKNIRDAKLEYKVSN